ncbi:hypothetical protein L484_006481 [Morus notabilis]|uniref:Uncharacterized protein n=1 Tax=Morus notabilis TaxID=981085 RepID=W9R4F9_9ROSA|nr:hypothetical protein L484_006481 [Morus notabilis]
MFLPLRQTFVVPISSSETSPPFQIWNHAEPTPSSRVWTDPSRYLEAIVASDERGPSAVEREKARVRKIDERERERE